MAKVAKRMKAIREVCSSKSAVYPVMEAIENLKKVSKVKFTESVDVAVMLGIDPKKSDQVVRGASMMPHGTGRSVRVAVFAQGAQADKAKEAGAEIVGFEDLAEEIKRKDTAGEKFDFDVLIATPDAMRLIGQIGRILGPRGLMPNPKVGTVTPDVAKAVNNAKSGQVTFRADKSGIVHCTIGKITFDSASLKENLERLVTDLRRAKPATSKGVYLKKIILSSTMGPGLTVDQTSIVIG